MDATLTPKDRGTLLTEQANPASCHLEAMTPLSFVELMNREDVLAVQAVGAIGSAIAEAIIQIAQRMQAGGRLIYIGAGTSGRLGVLDASECPPTFCSTPDQVLGIIAGGYGALTKSVEGAEDDPTAGSNAMAEKSIGSQDTVVGIAAGGTTPYVHGALQEAQRRGGYTIFLTCVPTTQVPARYDLELRPLVGAEVLAGSTRLKAGTATKLVLNMLSTGVMIQLGKVYDNLMVDVAVTNQKLHDRATRILMQLTHQERGICEDLLAASGNQVKLALVMYRQQCSASEAQQWLQAHDGKLTTLGL
jgi:N-acetylmuramic acid 6-phosphate etherase